VSNPLHEERCFRTTESILVDGANGVCQRPESHRPLPDRTVLFAVALAFAAFLAFSRSPSDRRNRQARVVAIVAALALLALPGLWGVLVRRGDAPAERSMVAHEVHRLVAQLQNFSAARGGCVEVVDDGCAACAPIARFALSDPHPCARHGGRVLLYAHTLTRGCIQHGDTLVCGDPR
jgi:hypothetical protein